MGSVFPTRVAKIGYVAASVLLGVLGICLIADPGISAEVLGMAYGILLMLSGMFRLVGYFSGDLFRLAFQYDLATGILDILVGMALLLRPAPILSFFCVFFGVMALADGLFRVQVAVDARVFGLTHWWLILASAALVGIFGFLLILYPYESTRVMTVLLGVTLLSESVMNVITALAAIRVKKKKRAADKDIYDVKYEEKEL